MPIWSCVVDAREGLCPPKFSKTRENQQRGVIQVRGVSDSVPFETRGRIGGVVFCTGEEACLMMWRGNVS